MKHIKNDPELTKAGAPRPDPMSSLWNDWAANNPTPQAIALGEMKMNESFQQFIKGTTTGARPVNWIN
tara:strand:- start:110 stop:313 length:204 start_codon:yes stop_codon:yes gene_type:complete